jgi:hypothetical protein
MAHLWTNNRYNGPSLSHTWDQLGSTVKIIALYPTYEDHCTYQGHPGKGKKDQICRYAFPHMDSSYTVIKPFGEGHKGRTSVSSFSVTLSHWAKPQASITSMHLALIQLPISLFEMHCSYLGSQHSFNSPTLYLKVYLCLANNSPFIVCLFFVVLFAVWFFYCTWHSILILDLVFRNWGTSGTPQTLSTQTPEKPWDGQLS